MRKTPSISSPTRHRLAAIFTLLASALLTFSAAANADSKFLPEKAKIVAEKFEAYKKKATPKEIEIKRQQVIKYLSGILKDEASKANLDGALATKALIETLTTKSQPAAAKSSPLPARLAPSVSVAPSRKTSSTTTAKKEGLQLELFSIDKDAKRRLEFPFHVSKRTVTSPGAEIHCEIRGAADDSGDNGLEYQLVDPGGKVAKEGFLQNSDLDEVVHKTSVGGDWKIVIIDTDTELDGVHPGNNASVSVSVSKEQAQAALASTRP